TMAGSPALLLLLSLGLCCTTAQGQSNTLEARFLNRNMKHPQEGQRLELECLNYERNRPIFWIRLDKGGNLHFILSSTQSYPSTLQEAVKTAPNFEALRRGNSYRLVVKSFRTQDEGTYFCIQYINQVLHFSSGQRAFFPGATTAATTTHTATTQSSQLTKKDSSQQGSNAGKNKDTPRFYCKMVMWVNLAVTCLLLLTAITITITHCQSKSHPDTLQRFLNCKQTRNSKLRFICHPDITILGLKLPESKTLLNLLFWPCHTDQDYL
uniref:Ig-like domain-containing protein n=1 Tax=Phasianus colchicus TaxID=9054 RepID=A0A669PIZ0_PHACC